MKLHVWMEREGIAIAVMSEQIGRSSEAVRRYAKGLRIPDREAMVEIVRVTNGEVTANDFFGIASDLLANKGSGAAASPSNGQPCTKSAQTSAAA